eukprot:s735_g28.t1
MEWELQTWAEQLQHAVKVRFCRQAQEERPCVRRHVFDAAEAGTKEQRIDMKDMLGNEPRLVRRSPVATHRARRRHQTNKEKTSEFGLGQWLEILARINQDEAGWETISCKDGCGRVTHKRFAKVAAELIDQAQGLQSDYIVSMCGCAHRIFRSHCGLWKFSLAVKRRDEDGMPWTREGEDHGNDLGQVLHQVHGDESVAGQNTLQKSAEGVRQGHVPVGRNACNQVASMMLRRCFSMAFLPFFCHGFPCLVPAFLT